MTNFGRMVRDSAMITMRAYRKPPSLFSLLRSVTPDGLPFLKNGVQMHPRDIMSNSEWPYLHNGWSDLLHVRF